MSVLEQIIAKLIEKSTKSIDWLALSNNPAISMEFIERNQDQPFIWSVVAQRPDVKLRHFANIPKLMEFKQWIAANAETPLPDNSAINPYFAMNPNLTAEFVENNPKYGWKYVIGNKIDFGNKPNSAAILAELFHESLIAEAIDLYTIQRKRNAVFDAFAYVSPRIMYLIAKHMNLFLCDVSLLAIIPFSDQKTEISWLGLSENRTLNLHALKQINELTPIGPNFAWISLNPKLDIEMIEAFPTAPWDWAAISSSDAFRPEFVYKFPFAGIGFSRSTWDWKRICANPRVSTEQLDIWEQFGIDIYDNGKCVGTNFNIFKFEYSGLVHNPNITRMYLLQKLGAELNNWCRVPSGLAANPSLTLEMIEFFDLVDYDCFDGNPDYQTEEKRKRQSEQIAIMRTLCANTFGREF